MCERLLTVCHSLPLLVLQGRQDRENNKLGLGSRKEHGPEGKEREQDGDDEEEEEEEQQWQGYGPALEVACVGMMVNAVDSNRQNTLSSQEFLFNRFLLHLLLS